MKKLLKILCALFIAAVVYKGGQKVIWETKATIILPPSLDSWDPTERYEAAILAAKRFGGKS